MGDHADIDHTGLTGVGASADPTLPTPLDCGQSSASTTSHGHTIVSAAVGKRILFMVVSRGRDVNTPTCSNVTFTEVGTAAFSTTVYISVYVGVVSGSPSGTTITTTATGTDWIAVEHWTLDDALTPTGGSSANLTNTSAAAVIYTDIGPISPARGTLVAVATGIGDGTTNLILETSWPTLRVRGRGGVLLGAVGYAPGGPIRAWITAGTSGGDFAGLIVPIT